MKNLAVFCIVVAVGLADSASIQTHRRAERDADNNGYGVLYRQSLPVRPAVVSYALPSAQVQSSYGYLAVPAPRPTYVISRPTIALAPAGASGNEIETNPEYRFAWTVQAGDEISGPRNFGHSESRDGDRTNGRYQVELPDGRLQIVEYSDDGKSGFVATVTYQGEPALQQPPHRY